MKLNSALNLSFLVKGKTAEPTGRMDGPRIFALAINSTFAASYHCLCFFMLGDSWNMVTLLGDSMQLPFCEGFYNLILPLSANEHYS